jgi:chaperonin cofactor prefoldin
VKRPTKKQLASARELISELRKRSDDAQVHDQYGAHLFYESAERVLVDELLRDDPLLDWAIGYTRARLEEGYKSFSERVAKAAGT